MRPTKRERSTRLYLVAVLGGGIVVATLARMVRPRRDAPSEENRSAKVVHVQDVPTVPGSPRIRPDVILGPLLVVLVGVLIDRLRESTQQETVTAFAFSLGAAVALALADRAGFAIAGRYGALILFVIAYGSTEAFTLEGSAYPAVWAWATISAVILWFVLRSVRAPMRPAALVAWAIEFVLVWVALFQLAPITLGYVEIWNYSVDDLNGWTGWLALVLAVSGGSIAIWKALVPGSNRILCVCYGAAALIVARLLDFSDGDLDIAKWTEPTWHAVIEVLVLLALPWTLRWVRLIMPHRAQRSFERVRQLLRAPSTASRPSETP